MAYAKQHGFREKNLKTPQSIKRWAQKKKACDMVGACALDRWGSLASATSTGGKGFEIPGRVSDSAMPIGNYATAQVAVSATGIGEEIMAEGVAVKIATRVEDGLSLKQSFEKTFREFQIRNRKIGAIGLDHKGNWFQKTTTETLLYAMYNGTRFVLF